MAYDAATGNAVLFGGLDSQSHLSDSTWTWNGSTWTKQAPATSPPALQAASMAYNAATGDVVLFGGGKSGGLRPLAPGPGTARPGPSRLPRRIRPPGTDASMAADPASGNIVLYGGYSAANRPAGHLDLGRLDLDQAGPRNPSVHPAPRGDGHRPGHGNVLFGTLHTGTTAPGDTWTWG